MVDSYKLDSAIMIRRSSLPVSIVSLSKAERKKSAGEPRTTAKRRKSPLPGRRNLADGATSSSTSRLRPTATADGALCTSVDGYHSQDDSDLADILAPSLAMTTNGGSASDATGEDSHDATDPQRTKAAIEQLQSKILRTMERIKSEQAAKEENVNEYLKLSANADKQQSQRIKTLFEKRNQKSTQTIAQLQRKLEIYQKRREDVETFGVSGHKKPGEMLKDMGQGLKDVGANIRDGLTGFSGGVVDNIRGARDTIVSKPKEFAHLIKNKFGSADNINQLKSLEESQGSTDEGDKQSHPGSSTLPIGFKAYSDDDASSITSGSGPSGTQSSPHPQSHALSNHPPGSGSDQPQINLDPILRLLESHQERQIQLEHSIDNLKGQLQTECSYLKQALDEERYRSERLEEQINDLTELHQHEVTNIKQELASMEEKMEYQLEERTRDMQELLETCQTRITKMELQQQQQQLISMEGIENSNFRALITKLINVVLAVLAVIFVFVSTIANLLGPFLTTRLRILSTVCLVACVVATWQHWSLVEDLARRLILHYRHLVPVQ